MKRWSKNKNMAQVSKAVRKSMKRIEMKKQHEVPLTERVIKSRGNQKEAFKKSKIKMVTTNVVSFPPCISILSSQAFTHVVVLLGDITYPNLGFVNHTFLPAPICPQENLPFPGKYSNITRKLVMLKILHM